jgi:hypothetical protein
VSEQVANGADWPWGTDAATVTVTVFMNGGMPEESYDVRLLYKSLKRFMKPDAPVL